ncbi:MAG: histidine phosphatase family protein [Gammaproteobacteria bacterium]|nr:histidine phosphatase family protein [Gammaproteobacteria bacterium]
MTVDERHRRRRRLRRQAAVLLFLMLAFALAWFFESQATTTVAFVRYAELAGDADSNPGLSPAGQERAEELSRLLGEADVVAGVDAIFATQYRYTQETVAPLAKRLRLPVQVQEVADVNGLLERILRDYKGKIVLVVTHTGPLPELIRELHGSKKVPAFGATEHDNLYIVSIPWYGKVKTLRLKYGVPYRPDPPSAATPPASEPVPSGP